MKLFKNKQGFTDVISAVIITGILGSLFILLVFVWQEYNLQKQYTTLINSINNRVFNYQKEEKIYSLQETIENQNELIGEIINVQGTVKCRLIICTADEPTSACSGMVILSDKWEIALQGKEVFCSWDRGSGTIMKPFNISNEYIVTGRLKEFENNYDIPSINLAIDVMDFELVEPVLDDCQKITNEQECNHNKDCLAVNTCPIDTQQARADKCGYELNVVGIENCVSSEFSHCEKLICPDNETVLDNSIFLSTNGAKAEVSLDCNTDADCMFVDEDRIIKSCCSQPSCWDFSKDHWVSVNKESYNEAIEESPECISDVYCPQLTPPQCLNSDRNYLPRCISNSCEKVKVQPILTEEDVIDYINLAQPPHQLSDCQEYTSIKKIDNRWKFFCWSKSTSGSFEGYITESGEIEDVIHISTN